MNIGLSIPIVKGGLKNGGYASTYPPAQTATYVKAYGDAPWYTTDPAKSLTGAGADNSWIPGSEVNSRFHIDVGSPKVIRRVYYENGHDFGDSTYGAKTFTLWGSNNAASFAQLTYGTNTGWTQLTTSQATFDQHSAVDTSDPKYIMVTNSTAYRYYAFKIADGYNPEFFWIRRIELQEESAL